MTDIVADLRSVANLGGDTYSSMEVVGMVGRAANEIERLRAERDQYLKSSVDYGNLSERLRAALVHVRTIIVDASMTGFNCHDGDWAERLFASQAVTHAALNIHK